MSTTSPADLPLVGAARAVAARELSPVELTRACLERIDALDGSLRSFVTVDSEGALAQAHALADELSTAGVRGPLHGVPVGVKDLIDVAGLPTTAGSRILAGRRAQGDAPVVARLRAAGAVVVGKTNTQEFAYGVVTPPTRNPWDLDRIPGGSSGGSGAAVAARLCPGALGTDTAGSIRIPSALCGVTGLAPRGGIVSLDGIVPLAPSLDVCGPIARSVADVALLWSALGPPAALEAATTEGLRLAAPPEPGALGEIDPEVAAATEGLLATLAGAGATRVSVDIPTLREWDFPRAVPMMVEALLVHQEAGWYPERAAEYTAETRAALEYAERLPATLLMTSQRTLERLKARLVAALDEADVLVLPTTPVAAPTVAEAERTDEGHRRPVARALTRICGPVNHCRLAALSVPCGATHSGLPVGAQIIGRDEQTVVAVGLLYQSLTDWHERRPPLAAPT